ncbi:bacteriohemerythrin [Thiothrix nivea]|uniref:Hemerythrin-like metal-binding protein n=1 Tax=Thiothrix nivea (strain ATCC 35100 / DSM 5205 / JP2) TaxID=870187 RepID=A0A656HJE0_THINJ|nr:hemerythrin domain-containing protein [Thiothrix nivea]EIJ36322.1 hemerythrin-like metal-binding protein [Thiothrix nivea DSM 5205]
MGLLIDDFGAKYLLGVTVMDTTHREFADLVNQLAVVKGIGFDSLFLQLLEHTREHFAREEMWMQASVFPAIAEHHADHQRVLGDMTRFARQVERGLIPMARAYVRELPRWFALHAVTMDSALAAHIKATGYTIQSEDSP